MPRRKKIPRMRIGVDIGRIQKSIKKKLKGTPAREIWEQVYAEQGLPVFQAWLEHILPFVYHLATHPDLTEEQKQVAVKEFFRRKRQVEAAVNSRIAEVSFLYAKRSVATVTKMEAKPVPAAPLIV